MMSNDDLDVLEFPYKGEMLLDQMLEMADAATKRVTEYDASMSEAMVVRLHAVVDGDDDVVDDIDDALAGVRSARDTLNTLASVLRNNHARLVGITADLEDQWALAPVGE